jgi:hypothetical protein
MAETKLDWFGITGCFPGGELEFNDTAFELLKRWREQKVGWTLARMQTQDYLKNCHGLSEEHDEQQLLKMERAFRDWLPEKRED